MNRPHQLPQPPPHGQVPGGQVPGVSIANGTVVVGYPVKRLPMSADFSYRWAVIDAQTGRRGPTVASDELYDRAYPLPGGQALLMESVRPDTRQGLSIG